MEVRPAEVTPLRFGPSLSARVRGAHGQITLALGSTCTMVVGAEVTSLRITTLIRSPSYGLLLLTPSSLKVERLSRVICGTLSSPTCSDRRSAPSPENEEQSRIIRRRGGYSSLNAACHPAPLGARKYIGPRKRSIKA